MEWRDRVYRVSSASHHRLWQAANYFRAYASRMAAASSGDTSGPRSDVLDMVRQLETRVTEFETTEAKLLQLLKSRDNEIAKLKELLAQAQGETSAQGEARFGAKVEREAEAEGQAMGATEDVGGVSETATLDMLTGMGGTESPTFDLGDLDLDDGLDGLVLAVVAASRGPP